MATLGGRGAVGRWLRVVSDGKRHRGFLVRKEGRCALITPTKVAKSTTPARRVAVRPADVEDSLVRAILEDSTGERLAKCQGWGQARVFTQNKYNHLVHVLESLSKETGGLDTSAMKRVAELSRINLLEIFQLRDSCTLADQVGFGSAVSLVFQNFIYLKQAHIANAIATHEGDPEELSKLALELERVARASRSGIAAWGDRFADRLFSASRVVSKPLPVLRFGEVEVVTRGNLSLVTALQKHGKTATIGAVLAATMKDASSGGDTFGINTANAEGHAVIHLDTEQSTYDHHCVMLTALKRAERDAPPPWLYSYSVLGVGIEEVWRHMEERLYTLRAKHGGICLLIIDGIGDLVVDVNDAQECVPAVLRLQALAVRYNCAILNVLHLNPGSRAETAKSRGHLGSTLERKAEVDLRVVKDKEEVSTVFTACSRRESILIDKGLRFKWSPAHGMHMSVKTPARKTEDSKITAHREFCGQIFQEGNPLTYTEMRASIMKLTGLSEKSAERTFTEFKKSGLIEKKDGKWVLAPLAKPKVSENKDAATQS